MGDAMRRAAKSIVLVSPTLSKDFKLFSKGKVRSLRTASLFQSNSRKDRLERRYDYFVQVERISRRASRQQ